MGLFISVLIDETDCLGISACGNCVDKCPVSIFTKRNEVPAIDSENEDECTLCNLCMDVCDPKCIVIKKEYDLV